MGDEGGLPDEQTLRPIRTNEAKGEETDAGGLAVEVEKSFITIKR